MILRALAIAVGLILLAATAHIAIAQSGGYGTPHSFIVLAVAAGVGVGALTIGVAWSERRRGLAFAILIALLCGEAWGLLATGERIIAGREQIQAPLRDQANQHRAAVAALQLAESIKPVHADRSRLVAAERRKQLADDAARAAATDKNCRDNCRLLLQAAVDAAFAEVTAARREITAHDSAQTAEINNKIQAATLALRENPMPKSAAPLADRLGLPAWTLDLVTAALGSIAANGLAACMLAFGVHRRRSIDPAASLPPIPLAIVEVVPDDQRALPAPVSVAAAVAPARPVQRKPKPIQDRPRNENVRNDTPSSNADQVTKTGDVMAFAVAKLYPDARGTVLLTIAHAAYRNWCMATGCQPVDPGVFADDFAKIVRTLKLTAHMSPQGLIIRGATIPDVKSNAA
jgi:hypothetical protein